MSNKVRTLTMGACMQPAVSHMAPVGLMERAQYLDPTWSGKLLLPVRHEDDVVETITLGATMNARRLNGALKVVGDDWPVSLPLQLVGRYRLDIFSEYIEDDSRKVKLRFEEPPEKVNLLHDVFRANYVPCVHIRPADPQKPRMVMYIMYSLEFNEFAGFLPNNQDEVLKIMIDLNPAFDSKPLMPYLWEYLNRSE